MGMRTSGEALFVGGQGAMWKSCPPVRLRSPEDRLRIRPSSGQHSLAGGRQIPKSPTPFRKALTGGRRQFLLGFVSPEQARVWNSYHRRAIVRRRTAGDRALSSGQHSLAGGRRISKSPTPLRRALTGGRHQLLLVLSSPELLRDGDSVLRGDIVRRSTACESATSSG